MKRDVFRSMEEVRPTPCPSALFGEKAPFFLGGGERTASFTAKMGGSEKGSRNRSEGTVQLKFYLEKTNICVGWG